MKIRKLVIRNFRGIKELEWKPDDDVLVCLVGHGDSTKTSILKSIECALYPRWNLQLKDIDFYLCDPKTYPITIEIVVGDLPDSMSFGIPVSRCWDKVRKDYDDSSKFDPENPGTKEIVYNVLFSIDETLEPKWHLLGESGIEEDFESKQRSNFSVIRLDSSNESNFKWKYDTLLTKLTEKNHGNDVRSVLSGVGRDARQNFDSTTLPDRLKETSKSLSDESKLFGVGGTEFSANLDVFSPEAICLHDEKNVPVYMLGEGSKKLLLLTMEKMLLEANEKDEQHIILVDEVERGLEPHRLRHLILLLKQMSTESRSQSIITTHSPTAIVESADFGVYRVSSNEGTVSIKKVTDKSKIRKEPEGFFLKKVILCEGNTEFGVLRAFKIHWINTEKVTVENNGTYFIRAHGDEMKEYVKSFDKELGYEICVFKDSDKEIDFPVGVDVFKYREPLNIEQALCKEAPVALLKEIIKYCEDSQINGLPKNEETYDEAYRTALSTFLHDYEDRGVFRRIGEAEVLGQMIIKHLEEFPPNSILLEPIEKIKKWVYGK